MQQLDRGTISILGRDFQVVGHTDDAWFQFVKGNGSYHEFNLEHLRHLVGPDDICLDIGANVGMITLGLSILAPNGHVCAFEGSAATSSALKKTVEANAIGNISVSHVVVGRPSTAVKFFDMANMRSSAHYVPIETARQVEVGASEVSVYETKSVDQLVDELQLSRVDFIKIDVEGAELDVLDGASNTLKKFSPLVIIEFNSYTLMHFREIVPRHAIKQILKIFDEVYYFKDRKGQIKRLANTEDARESFLHYNLNHGFVDDLICLSSDTGIARAGALDREIRLAELEYRLAELEKVLADRAERVGELERLVAQSHAEFAEQSRKASELERLVAQRDAALAELSQKASDLERLIGRRDAALAEESEKTNELERLIAQREAAIREQAARMIDSEDRAIRLQGLLAREQATVQSLLESRSWRMSKPLRSAVTWLRKRYR